MNRTPSNRSMRSARFLRPDGALVLLAALLAATAPLCAETVRYAVVVGVSDYQNLDDVQYAAADATAFREMLLTDPAWLPENIQLLTDSQATKAGIQAAIAAVAALADSDDLVVFFFSGRGDYGFDLTPLDEADDYDEYLCPHDSSLFDYSQDIRDEVLAGWLAAVSAAQQVLIIDADCGTGLFVGTSDVSSLANATVLSACAAGDFAFEDDTFEHGMLTYYLLEAGASLLVDGDSSGALTAQELFNHAMPRTAAHWFEVIEGRQVPQFNNNAPAQLALVAAPAPRAASVIAAVSFDTDPLWTLAGAWAWGQPQGLGGQVADPDPASGYTGANVYGYNLAGDYANSLPATRLTSPAFNCTDYCNVRVRFRRWLGVESSLYDHAALEISNDGSTWDPLWSNGVTSLSDTQWILCDYDVAALATNRSTVYLRWTMGPTDSEYTFCGWNIDDLEIRGDPMPQPLAIHAVLDYNWVYQNATQTTEGRHKSVLTISVESDPNLNETYSVAVTRNAASTGQVVLESTADPFVWHVKGGLHAVDPTGPLTLDVTVTGNEFGGQGTAQVPLTARLLGDITGDAAVGLADKLQLNKRLNGLATTGYGPRHFDLNGDGVEPNLIDKLVLNKLLNGLPLP